MKRSVIIAGLVALLGLATVRLFIETENEFEDERRSYIRNLNYNFSASVDSIIVLNKNNGRGFLVCDLTEGQLNGGVEDSLKQHLRNHEWMRFLFVNSRGQAQIFQQNVFKYNLGDSVYVNSSTDEFHIYRNEKALLKTSLTLATIHKVSWESWLKNQ